MVQQPIGAALDGRVVRRNAAGGQADQRLPGAVDVVDTPAAVPAAVAFLRSAEEFDSAADGGVVGDARNATEGVPCRCHGKRDAWPTAEGESFEGAAGQVGRAG